MAKTKVKPLPTERPPKPYEKDKASIPIWMSIEHKVKDGEDWEALTWKYGIDASTLMRFNFDTDEPDVVNWYLREWVGCNVPDARGWNWKFSNSADPGIIYIPPVNYSFDTPDDSSHVIKGKPPLRGVEWADRLNETYPSGGPHKRVLALEIFHIVVLGLEIFEVHGLLVLLGVVLAPAGAQAAVLGAIGGAHQDGLAVRKKDLMRDGYAMGVVLGANGASPSYAQSYIRQSTVDRGMQNVYNIALASGFATARKLNRPQVHNLFGILHKRMQEMLGSKFPKKKWKDWTEGEKRKYYGEAAIVFKILFTKP